MTQTRPHIWLIGAGRMGGAMLTRWVAAGFARDQFTVINRSPSSHAELQANNIAFCTDITQAHTAPDVIVLAIKPQQFTEQFPHLHAALHRHKAVLISVMAGVPTRKLQALGEQLTIARSIPNTPASIGEGVSAIYAGTIADDARALVEKTLVPLGMYYWCDREDGLHDATAISGSGTAYVFSFLNALEDAARGLGLSDEAARASALQTLKGAALLAEQTGVDFTILADEVTSPNGTTRAARNVLDDRLRVLIKDTTDAARARSVELEKAADTSQ